MPDRRAGVVSRAGAYQNSKVKSILQGQQGVRKVQPPEGMRTDGLRFSKQQRNHFLERLVFLFFAACGHAHEASLGRSSWIVGVRRQRDLLQSSLTFVEQVP